MHSKILVVLGLCVATSLLHLSDADAVPGHSLRRNLGWKKDGHHDHHDHRRRHDKHYRRRLESTESSDYKNDYDDCEYKGYGGKGYGDYDYDYKAYGKSYSYGDYDDYKGYGKSYGGDCNYGYGYKSYGDGYGYYPSSYGYGGGYSYYPDYYSSYGYGYYPDYSYGGGFDYSYGYPQSYGYGYEYPPYFGYESAAGAANNQEPVKESAEASNTSTGKKSKKFYSRNVTLGNSNHRLGSTEVGFGGTPSNERRWKKHGARRRMRVSKESMNRLVMDYLVGKGYRKVAEAFWRDSATKPHVDLQSVQERMSIQQLLIKGQIQKARGKLATMDPDFLEKNSGMDFLLAKQELIELIKAHNIEDALQFAIKNLAPFGQKSVSLST
ncbi:hypothetical protein BBI17_001619 [Phytophthora kernoviae]|uniref:CTLH domain-containing protein n=1 Tax=Phytophthora kernoviae TaxID=325452 RepID=A0A421F921_9STRA|nr:hypothetical protein JM16_001354 [Phytophthora kernoviae]RLN31767.1 hypothetical protein BBI17_001619 [Phytophthora kernoviae]